MPKAKTESDDESLHPERRANAAAKRPKASRADIDLLLQAAWAQGAWIIKGGNQHFKVYTADGKKVIPIPATPSGYRTIRNKRAQLRRAGIDPSVKN